MKNNFQEEEEVMFINFNNNNYNCNNNSNNNLLKFVMFNFHYLEMKKNLNLI